jgi:hypothetical protein
MAKESTWWISTINSKNKWLGTLTWCWLQWSRLSCPAALPSSQHSSFYKRWIDKSPRQSNQANKRLSDEEADIHWGYTCAGACNALPKLAAGVSAVWNPSRKLWGSQWNIQPVYSSDCASLKEWKEAMRIKFNQHELTCCQLLTTAHISWRQQL